MKRLVIILMLLLPASVNAADVIYGVGAGVRYGTFGGEDFKLEGLPGFQLGVAFADRVKLNAAAGPFLFGVGGGLELRLFSQQSVSMSTSLLFPNRVYVAGHYNFYFGQETFKGLCLSIGYEEWDDAREGRSFSAYSWNVGYHF